MNKVEQYQLIARIPAPVNSVFEFMDSIENSGMHMTKNNAAMMGSKLVIEWLTENKTGVGAKYRWSGHVLWLKMDFTVVVEKWLKNTEKIWATVGEAKMIVIDWFQMYLVLSQPDSQNTEVTLGIRYTIPRWSLLGFLLGKAYAKWCVKSMIRDAVKHFKR